MFISQLRSDLLISFRIIVDREPPTATKTLPKIISQAGKVILTRLNRIQQTAVLRALTANEYMLLKGLPGTGNKYSCLDVAIDSIFNNYFALDK